MPTVWTPEIDPSRSIDLKNSTRVLCQEPTRDMANTVSEAIQHSTKFERRHRTAGGDPTELGNHRVSLR